MNSPTRPLRGTWPTLVALFLLVWGGCSDSSEEARDTDFRFSCSEDTRLAVYGVVGPTQLSLVESEPFPGDADADYFEVILESGEEPHSLSFTTRGTDGIDFRDHLRGRYDSGAENAETFEIVTRPASVPCDTSEGVICAQYGVDLNFDGELVGIDDISYPVESGTLTFTDAPGQLMYAYFEVVLGAQDNGEPEEGGEDGGSLNGCFRLLVEADLSEVN